jgi:hypothetical protein
MAPRSIWPRRCTCRLGRRRVNSGWLGRGSRYITGGVGKDTGELLDYGYRSEAHYLDGVVANYVAQHDIEPPRIMLEEKACHGGENARFSLAMLTKAGFPVGNLTAVTPATSARRLTETLRFEADKRISQGHELAIVHTKPSDYDFDPRRPADQKEAAKELLRLADWPEAGLLHRQADLDLELVEFARAKHPGTPYPPSNLATFMLRRLPPRVRLEAIKLMARRT